MGLLIIVKTFSKAVSWWRLSASRQKSPITAMDASCTETSRCPWQHIKITLTQNFRRRWHFKRHLTGVQATSSWLTLWVMKKCLASLWFSNIIYTVYFLKQRLEMGLNCHFYSRICHWQWLGSIWAPCGVVYKTAGLSEINTGLRAPDKVRKMNFNRLYLCHFFTESYVWPLVRIVSMRRF